MMPPPPPPGLATDAQDADPEWCTRVRGAPLAPVEDLPMPSFLSAAMKLAAPAYVRMNAGTAPGGLLSNSEPAKVYPLASSAYKQQLAQDAMPEMPKPTKKKETRSLTVKICNAPTSWGEEDVPALVEALGLKKTHIRYSAIRRSSKQRSGDKSRQAYVSFCTKELAQQFTDALTLGAAAGTIGPLEIGTMNEHEHTKVETRYRKIMNQLKNIGMSKEWSYSTATTIRL